MTELNEIPVWVDVIVRDIALAYPGLDADRLRQIRLKLAKFDSASARIGFDQYITQVGDEFFNVGRFLAIVFRVHDERRQREDLADRHHRAAESVEEANRHAERLVNAERLIAEMNADEIAAEWQKVESQLNDAGRSVFAKYDLAKIRNSGTFKAHVAEMLK